MNGCYTIGMILGLLLVAGSVVAGAEDVIEIDAPGILDVPGATYVLTKDVTAQRTAFMIKGDGITLDLGGHTVTYGTAIGVDRCSGVFLRPAGGEESFKGVPREGFGGGSRFTLRNGRLVQGRQPLADKLTMRAGRVVQAAGPVPGRSCFAVYVRGCRGLEISDLITEVNSRDTDNLYIRECADVHIHDNHCISSVREITDRHWPGTGVITVAGVRGPMDIHRNVIDGGGQWGIRVSGGDGLTGHLVHVHHNMVPPADYRKAHLLYAKRYTRANVDLAVEWTVHVTATDPAGKPISAVSVIACDASGEAVAEDITTPRARRSWYSYYGTEESGGEDHRPTTRWLPQHRPAGIPAAYHPLSVATDRRPEGQSFQRRVDRSHLLPGPIWQL